VYKDPFDNEILRATMVGRPKNFQFQTYFMSFHPFMPLCVIKDTLSLLTPKNVRSERKIQDCKLVARAIKTPNNVYILDEISGEKCFMG
jgi:hypothetical protein